MQDGEAKPVPGSHDGAYGDFCRLCGLSRYKILLHNLPCTPTVETAPLFFSQVSDPTSFDIEPEADTPHVIE